MDHAALHEIAHGLRRRDGLLGTATPVTGSTAAEPLTADVVIVGAGVAGALVAWKLAAAGVKVIVLESGPEVSRQDAVAAYQQSAVKLPETPYPSVPYAPRPSVANLQEYYVQEGPDLFSSTYERRVGGTTWHWLGTALRLVPNDFRLRTTYGVGVDWPVGYSELEPWYFQAEQALGVAGDSSQDIGAPRRNPFPLPAIPQTYLDRQVSIAVAKLGLTVAATPQARNSVNYDGRPSCCGNASCIPICPIHAKYDATAHTAKAVAAGAQIIPDAVVFQVEVAADGLVTGVVYKSPDKSQHRVIGRIVVVAAHAIETPKLLLMSRTDRLPNGVANSSGQVGRNLMDHPTQLSYALATQPVYPYRGPLATSGIESLRDGPFRRTRGAFRVEIGNDGWSWPGFDPVNLAPGLIAKDLRGAALIQELQTQAARQIRLASLVEQLPDPANRIVPAFDRPDAIGIPRPKITYRVDGYTTAGMAAAKALHQRIFDAVGTIEAHHGSQFFGAGHVMGTYRMGTNPKTAVVDPGSRAHDHRNLFLLGSGTFPTVGCSNPTLTIAALALRAAHAIQAELRR
ncbi:MAG TPA: GMC family oxidoreductase [bacterium]